MRTRTKVRREWGRRAATGAVTVTVAALVVSGCGGVADDASEPPAEVAAAGEGVFDFNEATIAEITAALESGTISSVELTAR